MEIIVFGVLYKRKKLTDLLLNGIKNCLFHLHQNFIIELFIMIELSGNIENVNFKIIQEWALLAKKKVEDNRTWLNKHIYKKLFQNNIHLISGIIKNIVVSVKTVEETNSVENNNLDIICNNAKISNFKNPNLKENIPNLRDFIHNNVTRNHNFSLF